MANDSGHGIEKPSLVRQRQRWFPLGAAFGLLCMTAIAQTPATASRQALHPAARELPVAATPGSQYPSLYSDGKQVWMSWLQVETPAPEIRRASLWFSVLNEQQWSAPQRIAQGDDWFVNWADFPSLVALSDGTLVAHWLRKSAPDSYAYDVQLAFSPDAGKTWSPALKPHDDETRTEHGFVSLLPQPDNTLAVIWLDGRDSLAHHERMQLRYARFDRNGRKLKEQVIDSDACTCCQTSAVLQTGQSGRIPELWLAYRDHSQTEVRDIAYLRLKADEWSVPALVYADGWEIPGCPVNGPAIAHAGGQIAVAWYTGARQEPKVQLAFATTIGHFAAPLRLDEGEATGRVSLTMADADTAIAGWLERRGEQAVWRLRRALRDGSDGAPQAKPPLDVTPVALARSSGFPRLLVYRERLILAWTDAVDGQPPRIRSASLPLTALP